MKVFSVLEQAARRSPYQTALVDEKGSVTYEELFLAATRLASDLKDGGIREGMGVGLKFSNGRGFVAALFGLSAAGAIVLPIGTNLRSSEVLQLVEEFSLHGILEEGQRAEAAIALTLFDSPLSLHLHPSRKDGIFAPHIPDAAFVRPTSGTTGKSKGVVLSHSTVLARIEAAGTALQLSQSDRITWVLPMAYHFVVSVICYVKAGCTILVCPHPLASSILSMTNEFGGTILYASPSHFALLASDTSGGLMPSLRLAISTASGLSRQIASQFAERFQMPLRQMYGIIELGLPLGDLVSQGATPGSIGVPMSGYQAKIIDGNGQRCLPGETGELFIKGAGMFDGYLSPPRKREELCVDGWFSTGDLAVQDKEGRFEIIGRKKSIIITAGNKVIPEEVEQVLNTHPAIAASRVIGKRHHLLGEIVTAEVQVRGNSIVDESEMVRFCKERLSSYKTPQEFYLVEAIPLTPSGKVVRYAS
jgi:long-chain acyl-CoA synthetase